MPSIKHWNRRSVSLCKRIVSALLYAIQHFLRIFPMVSMRAMCAPCFIFVSILCVFSFAAVADNSLILTQTTTADGITVNFRLPQLHVTQVKSDTQFKSAGGGVYHTVKYSECDWIQEPGYPRLPVTRLLLAVPADAQLNNADVSVNAGTSRSHSGVRLLLTQKEVPVSTEGVSVKAGPGQTDNGTGHLPNKKETNPNSGAAPYPSVLARIEMDGYIRSQRVISLSLHPVQYNAATRELRSYNSLTVFIPFNSQLKTRETGTSFNAVPANLKHTLSPYEQTFAQQIFNYGDYRKVFNVDLERARGVGAGRGTLPSAPAAPGQTDQSLQTRYKLYIDESGVYKVTAASLRTDWGIDLIGIDPRKVRLTHGDQEIPIYISGAVDRSFDAEDAIFFLAHSSTDPESPFPKNAYTLWNVYWLSIANEGQHPARVPQIEASPSDATAVQVPTFRSRVVFEEDHLTNNLEFVDPDTVASGDKHKWFDTLDFWYWDGIKNASEIGELRLEFPLYDVAKSFEPPEVQVVLQGGTPVTHEILAAVNGVQFDRATWDYQAQVTLSKSLRTWNNLKDVAQGETNVLSLTRIDTTFEEDTTRYPYHIYLNRFWVEYTRLFLAVNDQLRFRTPVKARQDGENKGIKHQFRIDAFLDPQITVFETDGDTLTAKLQGVNITRRATDNAMRTRLQALNSGDIRTVPNITYTATFQVPDTRTTEFIAVAETALRKPIQIETVPPVDLRNPLNGADYLILTHPRFRGTAEKLANWRATTGGGGYRTKVVNVTDVYNTFGDGTVHPIWIKNFLTYTYQNWAPPALSYLVILGDGTYDFRGIDKDIYLEPPELTGYIPPHYISTDSYGRTSADHWYATVSGHDEFVDFYVGRLSVESEAEADTVVDKIINYEAQRPNGAWRRRIISVADDEVSNSGDHIFKKSLNEIAKDHTRLGYETVEIYLEDVTDEVEANPEKFSGRHPRHVAKDLIINALGDGGVVAQYAGHGGRVVWAHEIIFDNTSIDKVKETAHQPFMLVLSCYNGYFDKPGEPSMAEKLLRKDRGGIIGMLSATRLTYGSGNDALNRIIFDMLFQRDVRQLGPLSFDSKLEYLLTEGTSQLDIMLEYTLFGDPAMQIAMADYEILPEIETKTVKGGDTLTIAPGFIQTARYDPKTNKKVFTRNTNFDGELTVKVVFPGQQSVGIDKTGAPKEFYSGDVVDTKTISVQRGSYPAVKFSVPENISPGDAHVEYYAENATEIAVGGDGFTVEVPKILDIKPKVVTASSGEDMFEISVLVSDENKETVSVVLEWRNLQTADNGKVALEPAETNSDSTSAIASTARWWKLPEPLPVPTDGSALRYDIQVTDEDDFVVISDYYRFYPYRYPNLSVVSKRGENTGQISYKLGDSKGAAHERFLSVDIEVVGSTNANDDAISENDLISELGLSDVNIEVIFFSGNPDIDENGIVDADANLLGRTQIKPNDWVVRNPLHQQSNAYTPDPLNINPIATVAIPISLRSGIHDVFVYVDPIFSEADQQGKVVESNEQDNIGYRQLTVSGSIVGDVPARTVSVDGGIRIVTPAEVVADKPSLLTVLPIMPDTVDAEDAYFIGGTGEVRNTKTESPFPIKGNFKTGMLFPVTLAAHPSLQGYTLHLNETTSDALWNSFKLQAPVTVEFDFDWTALQQEVIEELFGSDADVSIDMSAIEDTLSTAVEARGRDLGIYLWLDALANWTRLESEIKRHANGKIDTATRATQIRNNNTGDGIIRDVHIPQEGVDVGVWIALFETARTYRLLFIPEETSGNTKLNNHQLEEIARGISRTSWTNVEINSAADVPGFTFDIRDGETPFQFGDILRFSVTKIEIPGQEIVQFYASAFASGNRGNGTIQYLDLAQETTIPQDTWLIMFVSPTQFQIEGERTGVLTEDGAPIYGTVGKPLEHSDYGLNLLITQGRKPFTAGDRFLFETATVGTIQAKTSYLGALSCLRSEDTVPPDIQLTVGNQQHFTSGASVDAAPLIQATLTDARGIDYITRPVELALGRFGEFETIAETEYKLTQHPSSTQLILTYNSPELEPREYQLRLTASDLDGNEGENEITFHVHGKLQLVEPLNYPNPFTRDTTVTCELTKPAKSLTVKIYTLTGRLIRQLKTEAPAGFVQLKWDGKDDDGNEVANGVYYGKIIVKSLDDEKDQTHILKMMKLK
ncbi:hypothetical protein C6501_02000 [Candidatus Poribacteria bacterium]|nr:MAG: hypothetical protein C6501_02000 [Candidatus Poribacteria bacterium]